MNRFTAKISLSVAWAIEAQPQSSELGTTSESSTRIEIDPGARSLLPANEHLAVFAAFGSVGFGRSLAALLWMSTILSAVIGFMRREAPFDKALNHWDETVAYAALCCLVSAYNQSVPL
jgi:hypothetical protein